jgi:hypothetical protein
MTESDDALPEQAQILAIAKTAMILMNENAPQNHT